jgi:hypothetical protein
MLSPRRRVCSENSQLEGLGALAPRRERPDSAGQQGLFEEGACSRAGPAQLGGQEERVAQGAEMAPLNCRNEQSRSRSEVCLLD